MSLEAIHADSGASTSPFSITKVTAPSTASTILSDIYCKNTITSGKFDSANCEADDVATGTKTGGRATDYTLWNS